MPAIILPNSLTWATVLAWFTLGKEPETVAIMGTGREKPWINRHSTKIMAVAPVIGLLWQEGAHTLRPTIVPLAATIILLTCVRMD